MKGGHVEHRVKNVKHDQLSLQQSRLTVPNALHTVQVPLFMCHHVETDKPVYSTMYVCISTVQQCDITGVIS